LVVDVPANREIWYLEFGHSLNLLRHGKLYIENKISSDKEKIDQKIENYCAAGHVNDDCNEKFFSIMLFSDFVLRTPEQGAKKRELKYDGDQKVGALIKYCRRGYKTSHKYFDSYEDELISMGFNHCPFKNDSIRLWWLITDLNEYTSTLSIIDKNNIINELDGDN
jgi:hypothetical protein